jgi:hypothetical protein
MAHTSIWVPGTIVQAEHPGQLTELIRKGWGTFFKQHGGFNWFHIPIAAPFALDGQNLVLTTVFVFYRAADGPQIRSIHVYGGAKRIQGFDDLHAAGDNTDMSDRSSANQMWTLSTPAFITSGLGISVGVDFKTVEKSCSPVLARILTPPRDDSSQL